MNDFDPIVPQGHQTQIDDPQIGQASSNHQDTQTVWIGQVTFIKVKPTALLVGEKGFDLKTFFIPIDGLIRQIEIGDQKDRVGVAASPAGNHHHRAIALLGEPNIGDADLLPWSQAQIGERKETIVFVQLRILGRPTDIAKIERLQSRLKLNPIEFSIPKEDGLTVLVGRANPDADVPASGLYNL